MAEPMFFAARRFRARFSTPPATKRAGILQFCAPSGAQLSSGAVDGNDDAVRCRSLRH
jgi:hypothetical protein